MIVDSCRPASLGKPAALEYLKSIGVPPDRVLLVVVTHWHDDHICGIAEVLESCPNARFVMATALQSKEFIQYARFFGKQPETEVPGGAELWRCLELVKKRAQEKGTADIAWATSGRILLQKEVEGMAVEVASLSPSDADLTNAIAMFGELLPAAGSAIGRPKRSNPNHAAVVLRIRVNNTVVLLGADLETTKAADTGWNAVVSCLDLKAEAASLYKVAHHGSETGEHREIWTKLLTPKPVSLLTPFRHGSVKLPTQADQTRLKSTSSALWCTSRRAANLAIPRGIEKTMSRKARSMARSAATYGIVRARKDARTSDEWHVEGFGAADKF